MTDKIGAMIPTQRPKFCRPAKALPDKQPSCAPKVAAAVNLRGILVLASLLLPFPTSCAKEAATVSLQQPSSTKQISQLLREPQRWQYYGAKERFAMYNNVLKFYDDSSKSRLDSNHNSISSQSRDAVFSPEIQRLDDIFLSYINTNPEDPYNSYYLYNVAGHYIKRGEENMGLWLLRSMYQKFPDLSLVQYPSIYYLVLDTLGRMERNIDHRIDAIQRILISLHDQQQTTVVKNANGSWQDDRGVWLYRLGKAYETKATELFYSNPEMANHQLRAAMNAYNQFFNLDSVTVPEEHNARNIVASKLNIYTSQRNWYTDPDLENLTRKIKYAIQNNNVDAVLYYQANNFFVLSADYQDEVGRSGTKIYLPHFLGGTIQFGSLTPESNDEEAWLYSTNWPFRLTTWYLYFRKIHYPVDPEIDGNWEWAGIYLGDFY